MLTLLLLAAVVLVLGWLLLPHAGRSLIYYPGRVAENYPVPALEHADVTEIELYAEDGVRLSGWWASTRHERAGTILYMHGNAGSLHGREDILEALTSRGFDTFMIDYRGYGKSGGSPSEVGLYRDAEAAARYVEDDQHVPLERVVLVGKSLGSAVAVELATRRRFAGLVVESGFTSVRDMGRLSMPWIPGFVYALIPDRFDALSKIARVRSPVLVIHGSADDLTPVAMGRRLFDAAPEPREWLLIEGGGHDDPASPGEDATHGGIADFARSVLTASR